MDVCVIPVPNEAPCGAYTWLNLGDSAEINWEKNYR